MLANGEDEPERAPSYLKSRPLESLEAGNEKRGASDFPEGNHLKRIMLLNKDLSQSESLFPDSITSGSKSILRIPGAVIGFVAVPMYTGLWSSLVVPFLSLNPSNSDFATDRDTIIANSLVNNLLLALLVPKATSVAKQFGKFVPDSTFHGFNWKDPYEYVRGGGRLPLLFFASLAAAIEPVVYITTSYGSNVSPFFLYPVAGCGWAANTVEFYTSGRAMMMDASNWWIEHVDWTSLLPNQLKKSIFSKASLEEEKSAIKVRRKLVKKWKKDLKKLSLLREGLSSKNAVERAAASSKLQAFWELATVNAKGITEARQNYFEQSTFFDEESDRASENLGGVNVEGEQEEGYQPPSPPRSDEIEEGEDSREGTEDALLSLNSSDVSEEGYTSKVLGLAKKGVPFIIPSTTTLLTYGPQTVLAFYSFHRVLFGDVFVSTEACSGGMDLVGMATCAGSAINLENILSGGLALSASTFKGAAELRARFKRNKRYEEAIRGQEAVRSNNYGRYARGAALGLGEVEGPVMVVPLAIELMRIMGVETASELMKTENIGPNIAKLIFASSMFPGASSIPMDKISEGYETSMRSLGGIFEKARLKGYFNHCGGHSKEALSEWEQEVEVDHDSLEKGEWLLEDGNQKNCAVCASWRYKLDKLIDFQRRRIEALKRYSNKELMALEVELTKFRETVERIRLESREPGSLESDDGLEDALKKKLTTPVVKDGEGSSSSSGSGSNGTGSGSSSKGGSPTSSKEGGSPKDKTVLEEEDQGEDGEWKTVGKQGKVVKEKE
ncbi:MAG: hypothetical protein HOI80_02205 [Alphaproteobacteria bacterium]|nr:hypothetical protein [Alphaproteobacteria bacterium]